MATILKLLGGSSGGWILAGSLLAAALFGAAGGSWFAHKLDAVVIAQKDTSIAKAQGETKQCHLGAETARANGNAGVIDQINSSISALNAATANLAAQGAARDKSNQAFLERLSHAPQTSICGTSDAERALRDSVRAQAASTP